MNICMVGHVYPIPPTGYAGVERAVWWWIRELRDMGHKVYLISERGEGLEVDGICAKTGNDDAFVDGIMRFSEICKVVHDNNDCHNPDPRRWGGPYIYTAHACVWPKNPNPIFLSFNQARYFGVDEPRWVIHNGIPVDEYPFYPDKEDYLVWCASIRACKAPEMAVQLAIQTRLKLKIIGPIQEDGFEWIRCLDPGQIEYLGEMGEERLEVIGKAAAFLYTFSDSWMEGYNLVNLEAMALGTPVIGLHRSNNTIVDEQFDDGVAGFHCESYEDMQAVLNSGVYTDIDPAACRETAEGHGIRFTVERYVEAYEDAVGGNIW